MDLAAAEQYCRELSRHYENFSVGYWLIPPKKRQDLANIYAYCRHSDDLADEGGEGSGESLKQWEAELEGKLQKELVHPILIALRDTVRKNDLPLQPFRDLLTAFKQDQFKTRYETFEELLGYCKNSANPVGRIYLMLFSYKEAELFRLSDEICTGLQLANFWQDVALDLDKGRIYIPREDMMRFGYGEERLCRREYCREFRELMEYECRRTGEFFRRGKELEGMLPWRLSFEVRLFRRGGEKVLEKIRRLDYNVLNKRAVMSHWDKAGTFLHSFISAK